MRFLPLASCVAAAALMAAASPAFAQAVPQDQPTPVIPPVETPGETPPTPSEPTGPLIDDAGPLPDVGEDMDLGEEEAEIVLPIRQSEPFTPAPTDAEGRSVYGLFLAGRAAMGRGQNALGADYLANSHLTAPDQQRIKDQAFTAALLAGDLDLAARIAPVEGQGTPTTIEAGRLVAVVRDVGAGQAREANAALTAEPIGFPHARAGLLVQPWIAAAAGDWTRALAEPPAAADPIATAFARYHRALLLEARRDQAGAEAQYRQLAEDARTAPLFRVAFGGFLERRNRRDEALALYDAAIAGGASDLALTEARARAAARGRPPEAPTLVEGAAMGLSSAAAAAMAEQVNEFAVVYLRLALGLDPQDETRLLLAQALSASTMNTAAREMLGQVTAEDPRLYATAQQQLAWSLEEDDQHEAAIAAGRRALAARPTDPAMIYSLASLLMTQEQYAEALDLLNRPEVNTADQAWQVRFQRGAAYESLGRVPEAEAELWAALQAQPDNPELLNYLGYLWVDSGGRVAEGAEMIARAVAAAPDNGHIQDSLGWAQYRQGRYEEAVQTLETAIALEPASAEITDHLGDAYWQVGRRREAGFQWSRVLTLEDATDEERASAQAKIDGGLQAVVDGAQP